MKSKIEISHKTIIFTVVLLISLWLVFEIREIIFLLFISFILMSAIRPLVERLEKKNIPRALSILVIYVFVFGLFGMLLSGIIPPLVSQTTKFINDLPRYVTMINPYYQIDIRSITSQVAPIGENLLKVTVNVFSNFVTSLSIMVFTFYLLLERKNLEKYTMAMFRKETGEKIVRTVIAVETDLGSWLRGQMFLMGIVGSFTYAGLLFLGIDFALPLAIIAGILEIVPLIGPFIAAVPAVLIAMTVSPLLMVLTIALYFIVQQLENHLVVPYVMNRTVGLSPLIVIIALMVGSRLGGTEGAILAIPVVVMLRAVILNVFDLGKTGK